MYCNVGWPPVHLVGASIALSGRGWREGERSAAVLFPFPLKRRPHNWPHAPLEGAHLTSKSR